jgi:nitrate reductase gamma subunit
MDLFTALALLIALALLFLCLRREKLVNIEAYRKTFTNLIVAVVLHNPAADLFSMVPPGIWGLLFRVAAYVFVLLGFRQLCLAFGAPLEDTTPPPQAKSP